MSRYKKHGLFVFTSKEILMKCYGNSKLFDFLCLSTLYTRIVIETPVEGGQVIYSNLVLICNQASGSGVIYSTANANTEIVEAGKEHNAATLTNKIPACIFYPSIYRV